MRILIIDDESGCLLVIRLVLERAGHMVLSETNPRSALERFCREQDTIDLVLLDWTLPGWDSRQVLDGFLSANAQDKLVIMTGMDEDAIFAHLDSYPRIPVLRKPFTVTEIDAIVESHCSGPAGFR